MAMESTVWQSRRTVSTLSHSLSVYSLVLFHCSCFMPSAGAAGISTAVPILLALLVGVGMLSHSCFYWSRWEDIKSLYKDTYNKRGIRDNVMIT